MLAQQHVKVFAVFTFAILVALQFLMPSLVSTGFDPNVPQQQQTDKKFIHWDRITVGRFSNQFLSHLMVIELAKGLGRSIIPPSFDINSDNYNNTTIVPFTSMFSVKPKITRNNHQQLQQQDERKEPSQLVEQQVYALEEVGKSAPYQDVHIRHAHGMTEQPYLRMQSKDVWMYARDRWMVCLATHCKELVRNIQMFEWAEPIASLIKSFVEQQDENGQQDTVSRSLGVHLRGGDWEHFCQIKAQDPRRFAYSCYQKSVEELIANIESVRRQGQKIFLATNYPPEHPLVQGLEAHYGDLIYRLGKLPKEYVQWTPFVEMGVLSRTERALLNRYSSYSGVVSVMMHFRNIHYFKHYSSLFGTFYVNLITIFSVTISIVSGVTAVTLHSRRTEQQWPRRLACAVFLISVLWHTFAFLMTYSHLFPFKLIYAFIQAFYVIYFNLAEACMIAAGCLITTTGFAFALSSRQRYGKRQGHIVHV